MGSQTLEILRQGVWASLTGGWFYDPHQDVFCNTFHLYLWLYLLCFPFTIFIYFPPTKYLWYLYCVMITMSFVVIKIVNYLLHKMYDTTEKIEVSLDEQKNEEEGIEMQILRPSTQTTATTAAAATTTTTTTTTACINKRPSILNSEMMNDVLNENLNDDKPNYVKISSTIDLKAEVHRKNSSESSEDLTLQLSCFLTDEKTMKENNERRHSNFTNTSLNYIPNTQENEIKATGSLELSYIDKNPNQIFFKSSKVRRIRSTALETCCRPLGLASTHPNSFELIDRNKMKNAFPPSTSNLIRNNHNLNLCFGSEIVYPIAEQSDVDSLTTQNVSDTDYDEEDDDDDDLDVDDDDDEKSEIRNGSRSPLLLKMIKFDANDEIKKEDVCKDSDFEISSPIKRGYGKRYKKKRHLESKSNNSLIELDLDWLFDDEKAKDDSHTPVNTSLEQDVEIILQDPNCGRNLGAIPKQKSTTSSSQKQELREIASSSSSSSHRKKTANHRHQHQHQHHHHQEKYKRSNCLPNQNQSIEGLECLVNRTKIPQFHSTPSSSSSSTTNRQWKLNECEPSSSSSSSQNNELSNLLPAPPLLQAFLVTRREFNPNLLPICIANDPSTFSLRNCNRIKHSNVHSDREQAIASSLSSGFGTHSAKNFNDTSEGAVHCFLDEQGNWITYTFDEKQANLYVLEAAAAAAARSMNHHHQHHHHHHHHQLNNDEIRIEPSPPQQQQQQQQPPPPNIIQEALNLNNNLNNNQNQKAKIYYKLKLFPKCYFRIEFDRLKLLALLDRNLTFGEMFMSSVLGVLVSVLGSLVLYLNYYNDLSAFIFCFIIASSQYSLLKSVQPDAASPTHGFNRIIAYSRPIYFCLFTGFILMLELIPNVWGEVFGYKLLLIDFIKQFILTFPLLFSIGLFPQINTFVLYILEQIDMHLFGGNAMPSLLSGFYCILRSLFAVFSMYGFIYGALCEQKQSQHLLFSIFAACLITCSYHLSRSSSDPQFIWNIIIKQFLPSDIYHNNNNNNNNGDGDCEDADEEKKEQMCSAAADPLPNKLQATVNARLGSDLLICTVIFLIVFALHSSTIFTALEPELSPVLFATASLLGFILHYIIPQMRKNLPWLCISRPILRSQEYGQYQIRGPARIMWFEKIYVYLCLLERNIIYPLLFLAVLTEESPKIADLLGNYLGALVITVCGLKCLRGCYSQQNCQYLILTFSALFYKYDYLIFRTSFLIDYFFIAIVYHKIYELLLKIQFILTYIAPWQITWGSAFHAFAQPFSVPHSAMLFLQAFISSILSTPLNPFLGSAIFITSYVRPIKFWERDYNTRRVDHSNTSLSSHLERNLGADDNNLNSIFYEHLTHSLQHSLCGDLLLGRWGIVNQGDCFVLASDYLNCLVHIIELGNGLVTFQMRGLEFKGTYCQQREVEAITEGVHENDGCCCCDPGHLPNLLSVNSAFSQRWLAWEVTAAKYILEGYSISDNNAASMLQVFDFRKVLISYYVKSIIFYTVRSVKLNEWLTSKNIAKALQAIQDVNFVDLDPVFNINIDEDFDLSACGMTRTMFYQIYSEWIVYCVDKSGQEIDSCMNSLLVVLCFALSLLGRRSLGAVSHNTLSSVEFFLFGLHALFKGDFRITCMRDEWVFLDMDFLKCIVAPGVRMSLKLHQDHFMTPDEYEQLPTLYEAICKHEEELVISHEGDPAWRNAILSGTQSLLALRHVLDEGTDEYKIIMLNKRYLNFRVIKINKECVRGLWAGQQQELVYLRNRNPERGSIQNAKQALRNIINSSCDQPIGYPIYVSPLMTSYAETNEQLCELIGGNLSLGKIKDYFIESFRRIRKRCGEGCSSGGTARDELGLGNEGVYAMSNLQQQQQQPQLTQNNNELCGSSLSRISLNNRGSLVSMGKPTSSTLASLAGLFKEQQQRDDLSLTNQDPDLLMRRVRIIDANLVYDCINLGRRIDVAWPNELMRSKGGRSYWRDWIPEVGMEGQVVHKWVPLHKDINRRSHVDRTILLLQIDDKFVPIAENGVQVVVNINEE